MSKEVTEMMRAHAELAMKAARERADRRSRGELDDRCVAYLDQVKATYIENWPGALCRLSIAQSGMPLFRDAAISLGRGIAELGETFAAYRMADERDHIPEIREHLDVMIRAYPDGVYVRLGSRSPKDAYYADLSVPAMDGNGALERLLGGSERIHRDLLLALDGGYEPWIWVRQWVDIEPWQEFRCFMRGRKLIGISQYFWREAPFEEVKESADSIRWAIEQRFFPAFREACHLDDVVFDVFVKHRQDGNAHEWQVKLLEINPFSPMTDPCLFDWKGDGDFDGSMRIDPKEKP